MTLLAMSLSMEPSMAQEKEWKEEHSEQGITILSRIADCSDPSNGFYHEFMLLRVVNANDHAVEVSFKRDLWYDGRCHNCDSGSREHITSLTLGPQSALTGECVSTGKQLRIFRRMTGDVKAGELTGYRFTGLSVKGLSGNHNENE